jgi:uncharacterized protein
MIKDKEQAGKVKYGLYSPGQLLISGIIGGPGIAGAIIAFNLWAREKKSLAMIPVLPGILLGLILFLPIEYGAHYIKSAAMRHILALSFFFLMQAGFAFLIRFIILKNEKSKALIFPEIDEEIYHRRSIFPVIILSIIFFLTINTFNFYLWIVLTFYLFTHFYLYILLHKTFGSLKIVRPFLAALVFLAALLPLVITTSQILFVYTHKPLMSYTYMNLIVGYYVIFIFYSFLFILALNFLLFINQFIRIVPAKLPEERTSVLIAILTVIAFGVTILAAGTFINNNPVITKYSVTIPRKASSLHSLKVISVSDLHLKNLTNRKFLKKMVNEIEAANPDIVFLPGDVAETYGNTTSEKLNEFIDILQDIKPEYGIYAVRGNHDYPGDLADKIGFYNRLGITMLADSLIEIDSNICIIGLKYRGNYEKRPVDSLLKFKTKDLPVILLDHAPWCLDEACKNNIDVQLSGHTHNGQIWPLNYITGALYELDWGYKKTGSTNLFVSCGVQDALLPGWQDLGIPVRTGSVSEIMEIDIEFR